MVGFLFCINYFVSSYLKPTGPQQAAQSIEQKKEDTKPLLPWMPTAPEAPVLPCHIIKAQSYIGVKEITNNGGPEIDEMLAWAGLGTGNYWCAAAAGFILASCNILVPKSAWCPAYFTPKNVVYTRNKTEWPIIDQSTAAYCVGFYYQEKKRIAHMGILETEIPQSEYATTLEGNTSGDQGGRNGDGFYRMKRNKKTIYQIAKYNY